MKGAGLSGTSDMGKVLTLIVPSYNMEDYLPYCLDSVLVRKNLGKVEVLVVNDGSKDRTSEIAHGYEKNYPDIFRVIDKDNGNYGSCVNRGLEEAKGKYVKVLDADDSMDPDNLDCFIAFLEITDADLVLSDFTVVDIRRQPRKTIRYSIGDGIMYDMDAICTGPVFCNMQMHAVTYRRRLLTDMEYRQTESISYTDQQWIALPMIYAHTVAYFDRPVYMYLVGRAGQTVDPAVKKKSLRHTLRCALDMAAGYERYRDDVADRPVRQYLYARIVPMLKDVYVLAMEHFDVRMRHMLEDFDIELKNTSPELYDYIGSREASSFMGFRYINWWRLHKDVNTIPVRILSRLYKYMLKIRNIRHNGNAMSVPDHL